MVNRLYTCNDTRLRRSLAIKLFIHEAFMDQHLRENLDFMLVAFVPEYRCCLIVLDVTVALGMQQW